MITHKDFIDAVDDAQVVAAIRQAEAKTSCELRVFVADKTIADPVIAAGQQFERMKMRRTRQRNAVLVFIAPRSQNFALFADQAAHQALSQDVWDALAAQMSEHFKQSHYTDGIVHVLGALADALAGAFPYSMDSGNELSDAVERG